MKNEINALIKELSNQCGIEEIINNILDYRPYEKYLNKKIGNRFDIKHYVEDVINS